MKRLRWIAVLAVWLPLSAGAQPTWTAQPAGPSVSVEWIKPSFAVGGTTFLSSAVFFSGRFVFAQRVRLVGELPVAHFGIDRIEGQASFTDVGNPYVGFELLLPEAPVWIEAGARASLVDDNDQAGLTGVGADFDRLDAFLKNAVTLQALGNYRYQGRAVSVRVRVGASVLFDTATGTDREDVFLRYGGQAWYDAGPVRVGGGLAGRYLLNAAGATFSNRVFNIGGRTFDVDGRLFNQATLVVLANFDPVFPGLLLRAPLGGNLDDLYGLAVGLQLTAGVGK